MFYMFCIEYNIVLEFNIVFIDDWKKFVIEYIRLYCCIDLFKKEYYEEDMYV